jgi:hypothetical protein
MGQCDYGTLLQLILAGGKLRRPQHHSRLKWGCTRPEVRLNLCLSNCRLASFLPVFDRRQDLPQQSSQFATLLATSVLSMAGAIARA